MPTGRLVDIFNDRRVRDTDRGFVPASMGARQDEPIGPGTERHDLFASSEKWAFEVSAALL